MVSCEKKLKKIRRIFNRVYAYSDKINSPAFLDKYGEALLIICLIGKKVRKSQPLKLQHIKAANKMKVRGLLGFKAALFIYLLVQPPVSRTRQFRGLFGFEDSAILLVKDLSL